ncbi:MAG TPA: type II toxin-antitoxin system Phd/YefM family antitoxin [Stellaceae bacterium]|nr:type II toxin-antitoxin system Phd/YefM family antitoxin [Stellaceae bacterium]
MDRNNESFCIPAAEFKAKCLRLLDEVAHRRTPIVVTKRGKPVAKLVPIEEEPIDLFGYMAGTAKICGDIVEPTGEVWEADEEPE